MAERHVVDAVEHGGGHGRDTADRDVPFAVAGSAAGDEGVGEDDGAGAGRAGGEVGAHPVHGGGEHRLVPGALHAELVPHQGGLQVGQAVEGDVPVRVGQQDRGAARGGLGPQVDAGAAHEPRADAEAAGRVVVSGDHHRGHAEVGEPVQRVVEQLDGGQRRHRPVVHVPRHHHRVHLALAHGGDEVTDELGLGAEHADPVEGPAEVPVGGVQESHGPGSVSGASDSADGCSRITRHVPAIGMSARSGANHPWCPHRPPASPACAAGARPPEGAPPARPPDTSPGAITHPKVCTNTLRSVSGTQGDCSQTCVSRVLGRARRRNPGVVRADRRPSNP